MASVLKSVAVPFLISLIVLIISKDSYIVTHQAAAYYYHGLILDEGNTEKSHGMAVAALQAADEYLKESKKASEVFNMAPPLSR